MVRHAGSGRRARPRAPRGSINEPRILAAALAVLARDGLAGVGIRSVARELGTAPMSLYRHVRDRDALIELLKQALITQPPGASWPPGAGGIATAGSPPGAEGWRGAETSRATWRDQLAALLEGARAQLRRHPRAIELYDSENFRQPAALFAVEQALTLLAAAGLDAVRAARASATLWMYTVGSVLAEQSTAAAWPGEDIAPLERTSWIERTRREAAPIAPRVAAAADSWVALSHDEVFRHGLQLLLDGVEREARRRASTTGPEKPRRRIIRGQPAPRRRRDS